MTHPLRRILDATEEGRLVPSSIVEKRLAKHPKWSLHDFVPSKTSYLLPERPCSLPPHSGRSSLMKQTLRISFHPQRVRRITEMVIDKGILPASLSRKRGYAQALLKSCKMRRLRKRKRALAEVGTLRPFCLFQSRQEQIEFSVVAKSLFQRTTKLLLKPQDLEIRNLPQIPHHLNLSGLWKLGYSGALPYARKEDYFRDFLAVRWFPDDEKRQVMIEKQASELKPRMTFT